MVLAFHHDMFISKHSSVCRYLDRMHAHTHNTKGIKRRGHGRRGVEKNHIQLNEIRRSIDPNEKSKLNFIE
jgi:hypothetical protein